MRLQVVCKRGSRARLTVCQHEGSGLVIERKSKEAWLRTEKESMRRRPCFKFFGWLIGITWAACCPLCVADGEPREVRYKGKTSEELIRLLHNPDAKVSLNAAFGLHSLGLHVP